VTLSIAADGKLATSATGSNNAELDTSVALAAGPMLGPSCACPQRALRH
jgi:hypothetical protein